MKRTLSKAILKKKPQPPADSESTSIAGDTAQSPDLLAEGLTDGSGGSGGAWKKGALTNAVQVLQTERNQIVERILSGRQELLLDPNQIVDLIGTDRREDWRDQAAFEKLRDSISKNGQDTPIAVWPVDPEWRPDEREPDNLEGIEFQLIVGRRRHAILKALGRPVRAILATQESRGSSEEHFETLFMRFRENEERENLSAFEQLLSVGEMFERLQEAEPNTKIKAIDFAERVGVSNSTVSRGRAVYAAREKILHACKKVYELSHRDLEKVLAGLSDKATPAAKTKPKKAEKLTVQKKIGSRKLSVTGQGGKLSIAANGLKLNQEMLDGLSDVIVDYLEKHEAE